MPSELLTVNLDSSENTTCGTYDVESDAALPTAICNIGDAV